MEYEQIHSIIGEKGRGWDAPVDDYDFQMWGPLQKVRDTEVLAGVVYITPESSELRIITGDYAIAICTMPGSRENIRIWEIIKTGGSQRYEYNEVGNEEMVGAGSDALPRKQAILDNLKSQLTAGISATEVNR
jgi:hypothetical protein